MVLVGIEPLNSRSSLRFGGGIGRNDSVVPLRRRSPGDEPLELTFKPTPEPLTFTFHLNLRAQRASAHLRAFAPSR